MKIILSPAKSLDFDNAPLIKDSADPKFIQDSQNLVNKLKKLSSEKIKSLMGVSDAIAALNVQRFSNWNYPFKEGQAKPAAYVFTGEAYRGLDVNSLSEEEVKRLDESLRILSGLYGLIKPTDNILPYRLEMGTRYAFTPAKTNLYKYWGSRLTEALASEMDENEILVNVASNEYNKAIDFKKLNRRVVTCHFKENREGEYKAIMTFAKRARGLMTRYIVQNNIQKVEDLKGFNLENYFFKEDLSSENELTFVR
ncbi:MAG: cytoplasmic iron level regulating protein YaaA (DUF328/UPF0246 family) [Flavobacteriales bacterium]|jgi:cytoplasmic iron level regulating protein YaaA (DUF328/UPF0246 family)